MEERVGGVNTWEPRKHAVRSVTLPGIRTVIP